MSPTRVDAQVQPKINNTAADTYYTEQGAIYQKLEQPGPKLPVTTTIRPTEDQYKVGEFRRFFYKKNNQLVYGEIDESTYTALVSRNANILWQLYFPFNLPWTLVGDQQQVFNANKNIVQLIAQRNNLTKFAEYLKNDYLKYYRG